MAEGILSKLPPESTVAVIRLRSLGDTVLSTPTFALLKQARPDLRLVAVAERPFDEILEGNPHLSRTIALESSGVTLPRWKVLREIRRERPRLCLNLHGGSTSAWLTALCGARYRAGFGHFRHRFAYNVLIPKAQQILGRPDDAPVHTAEHLASAIFYLGVPLSDVPRAVLRTAAGARPRPGPYAVLHVTAAFFTKQWPATRFRQIAEFLRRTEGLEPVMVAGPGEGAVFGELADFPRFEGLPLRELASLLAGADLFVGNDSGPAHVAAAFGVPSAVIFGSSNSQVWRPWKTPHEVVETDWECKPCPGDRCYAFEEPRCILSIEVAWVQAAIQRLLQTSRKADDAGRRVARDD